MMMPLSVYVVKIHHCSFWEFSACISEVAKLSDMVREVVKEMHLQKVEIRFGHMVLCNVRVDLPFIFINVTTLCRGQNIVPHGVLLPFLLFVQSKLRFEGFQDLVCRFTGAESTVNILLKMKLLQILLHVLYRGFSVVLVLFHQVKVE